MIGFSRRAWLAGLLALSVAGCGRPPPAAETTVTVLAAASLSDALTEIAQAYETAHPGVRVRLSFAASGTVANQILRGAPADLVLLADEPWMDRLAEARSIDAASRRDLLGNRLVVIAPANAPPAPAFDWRSLPAGRFAIGDPDSVPAGAYARTLLQRVGAWDAVRPRLVYGADVRAVRTFVAGGDARLGVVYRSDVVGFSGVRVVFTPTDADQPDIRYPAALTPRAGPAARAFFNSLSGPDSGSVFRRRGFETRP